MRRFVVEREDGKSSYLEWRYALARFNAPGSSWALIYETTDEWMWTLVCSR